MFAGSRHEKEFLRPWFISDGNHEPATDRELFQKAPGHVRSASGVSS